MPTITVNVTNVRRQPNSDIVEFTATYNDQVIERRIFLSEFGTWDDFANWLVNQTPDFVLELDKEKTLDITFHTETGPEGETVRVVDSVVVT